MNINSAQILVNFTQLLIFSSSPDMLRMLEDEVKLAMMLDKQVSTNNMKLV